MLEQPLALKKICLFFKLWLTAGRKWRTASLSALQRQWRMSSLTQDFQMLQFNLLTWLAGWAGYRSRRGGLHHESAQRCSSAQPQSAVHQQDLPGPVQHSWVQGVSRNHSSSVLTSVSRMKIYSSMFWGVKDCLHSSLNFLTDSLSYLLILNILYIFHFKWHDSVFI